MFALPNTYDSIQKAQIFNATQPLVKSKIVYPITQSPLAIFTHQAIVGYVNTQYDPLGVLFMVLRNHFSEFIGEVDGYVVNSPNDFYEVRQSFNKLFTYVKSSRFAGTATEANEDQLIKIGALFFILMKTAEISNGWLINPNGAIYNKWNGIKTTISAPLDAYEAVVKLKEVCLASIEWRAYEDWVSRTLGEDCYGVSWIYDIPPLDSPSEGMRESPNFSDLVDLMNSKPALHMSKDSNTIILVRLSPDDFEIIQQAFNFVDIQPIGYEENEVPFFRSRSTTTPWRLTYNKFIDADGLRGCVFYTV